MKAFFEEYGFVMLSAIVIIGLIAIASGLEETVSNNIKGVMNGFQNKIITEGQLTIPQE